MATLSPTQLYALARAQGLSAAAATTATAVALAESGGRSDAVGDQSLEDATWGPSVGPWQIRSLKAQYGTGGPRDASRLADPAFNASSMASISGGGSNWKPWSTYNSGSYKTYVSQVSGAVKSSGADSPSIWQRIVSGIGSLPVPGLGTAAAAVNAGPDGAAGAVTSGWAAGAVGVGMKIVGVGAAVALVVVGAVHTVSK